MIAGKRKPVRLLMDLEFRTILRGISATPPFDFFFTYNRVAVLELKERKRFRQADSITFRQATEKDLEPLLRSLGRKPRYFEEFKKRWDRQDLCFVAEANGFAVCVTWASFQPYRLDAVAYTFDPGVHGVFLYDAYTVPAWRLKGILVNLLQHLLDSLSNHTSVQRVYCAVEHGNDHSLRTHLRFGFKVAQYVTYFRFLGFKWHFVATGTTCY